MRFPEMHGMGNRFGDYIVTPDAISGIAWNGKSIWSSYSNAKCDSQECMEWEINLEQLYPLQMRFRGIAFGVDIAAPNRIPISCIPGNRIWRYYSCSKSISHFMHFRKSHLALLYKLQIDSPFHAFPELAFGGTI